MVEALAMAGRAGDIGEAIVSCYEVHVLRDERWVIDCMSRDAEEALTNAHDLARRAEVLGVKVIHERYNPRTDQSAARVVYSRLKPPRPKGRRLAPIGAFVARSRGTSPGNGSGGEASAAAPTIPDDRRTPSPSITHEALRRRPSAADIGSWHLFAWASLALAVTASLLFLLLLLVG